MAEIKISDLSVGDWVRVDDFDKVLIKRVSAIDGTRNQIGIIKNNRGGIYWYCDDEIEPIPLTPEIFEKNGFVKWQGGLVLIGNEISCRYEDGNLTIKQGYRDNEGVLVERLLVNIECLSVHQLQHALRLAGVEKEIEV